MPSRRDRSAPHRPAGRQPSAPGPTTADAAERFAAALKESEAIERERRRKEGAARAEQAQVAAAAAARADELRQSRRRLERAIEAVREAKRRGSGAAEADREWKIAKARVIELETGSAPSWAPTTEVPAKTGTTEETRPTDDTGEV